MVEDETPEKVLARNWSILGSLRQALNDPTLPPDKREEMRKLALGTEKIIQATQRKVEWGRPHRDMSVKFAALNGAALGAAVAVLRICWTWPLSTGRWPFYGNVQAVYVYMVFWYALAGAAIFVVARNVLKGFWK